MRDFFRLIRLKHWIKNLLIFVPLFFNQSLFKQNTFLYTGGGLVAFSLMTSFVYIVNDIYDIPQDRKHPIKRNRPLASGKIKIKNAVITAIIFLTVSVIILFCLKSSLLTFAIYGSYIIINILYSAFGCKNIPLLDIFILALGFLIRIFFGASIAGISISNWLYLVIISGSLYMGLGKRRNELRKMTENNTRKVLRYYTYEFLDKNMYMCMAIMLVFYSLWCSDHSQYEMIYTVPLVILISMKYSLVVEGEGDGDPLETLINDKILLILMFIYILLLFWILYILS